MYQISDQLLDEREKTKHIAVPPQTGSAHFQS